MDVIRDLAIGVNEKKLNLKGRLPVEDEGRAAAGAGEEPIRRRLECPAYQPPLREAGKDIEHQGWTGAMLSVWLCGCYEDFVKLH